VLKTREEFTWTYLQLKGGREILVKLSLCYTLYTIILVHNQSYEQFLEVGRLYRALILLGVAFCLPSTSVSSVFMVLYVFKLLCYILCFTIEWVSLVGLALDLVDHCPSVLWHCWLGHQTIMDIKPYYIIPLKSSQIWPIIGRVRHETLLYHTKQCRSPVTNMDESSIPWE